MPLEDLSIPFGYEYEVLLLIGFTALSELVELKYCI
jgi:hypothetical protein